MRRFFCSVILIGFSALLFGGFGAACAFAYKALAFGECRQVVGVSSKLTDFLSDSSARSAEFTAGELEGGAAHIIFKCAKKDNAGVLPALPIFSETDGGISVRVPVVAQTPLVLVKSSVVFEFSADGVLEPEKVGIGSAVVPDVLRGFVERGVCAEYKPFIAEFRRLSRGVKITKRGKVFVLEK